MHKYTRLRLFCLVLITFFQLEYSFAQKESDKVNYPLGVFDASWIGYPGEIPNAYGVYHLRKVFELSEKPARFVVHVSGDQRYRLFVNGTPVCFGPARGDLRNWNYETMDISTYLKAGKNVLAAQLWHMGAKAPAAQVSFQTGFILQGNSDAESLVNTDDSWRIIKNKGYFPQLIPSSVVSSYIVGSCDSVIFKDYPFDWQGLTYDDSDWLKPAVESKDRYFNDKRYLKPRCIPFMEEKVEPITGIVRTEGVETSVLKSQNDGSLYFPANSKAVVLFDIKNLTTGYPEITFSRGANSKVKIIYAESLFDGKNLKGNRNEINEKHIRGVYDVFYPDNGINRLFRPLWMRTFRYIQFEVTTADEPLILNHLQSVLTVYPFKQVASFSCNDQSLEEIWNVGWRTARLCANETYMDCPYYEQLQYAGDTRIQALISLYVSGDVALMKNAIEQFHQSQIPDGLTKDAYPAGYSKIITPFSFFWVSMIYDYYWYRDDWKFVEKYLIPIESVLKWFEYRLDPNTGMLGKTGFWNFVDWSFPAKGTPPGSLEGNSSILTLHYVYALEQTAQMMAKLNQQQRADYYTLLAIKIKKAVYLNCYDNHRGLLADTPDKNTFSQHANIWGILTDCIPSKDQKAVMEKVVNDLSLTQSSLYFRSYYAEALNKSGLGNLYVSSLQVWKDMLALGLTTFPETAYPTTRSDCHAWSSSPCYDFLGTICGIHSDEPGFKSVRIEPNIGNLTEASGIVPHPMGLIKVSYKKSSDGSFVAEIELPDHLTGRFVSKGKSSKLKSGYQKIRFR